MVASEGPVIFRAYQAADYDPVAALWTRVNRELAPPDMRELFEHYITTAINGELRQLQGVFAEAKRNAFWVVEADKEIVGTFGIESRSEDSTELRRMYLDRGYRSRGIAQRMLQRAEARARELSFSKMILSTAGVQKAAIVFYGKNGRTLGYVIVGGGALPRPAGAQATVIRGVEYQTLPLNGRLGVTWRRGGHTCVLLGDAARAELLALASRRP